MRTSSRAALCTLLLPGASLWAANSITFSTSQSDFGALAGATVPITVYLTETGSAPFLLDSQLGLSSAGLRVTRIANPGPDPAPIDPAFLFSFTPDAALTDPVFTPFVTVAPASATALEFAATALPHGAQPAAIFPGSVSVPLGVLMVTAGPTLGDVTTFSLSDVTAGSDTVTYLNRLTVDPAASTSIQVTVVPEPASLVLLGMGLPLALRPRRRTKR